MQNHPKQDRTLVVIKPDGVQRSLIGEIIKRFEQVGLKMAGVKMFVPSPDFVEQHYSLDPNWRRVTGEKRIKAARDRGEVPPSEDPLEVTEIVLRKLRKYLSSGPVIAMVWQGGHAVDVVRKLVGSTEPRMSDVGSIRGDYVHDSYNMSDLDDRSVRNLVHASGDAIEAEKEIKHWFVDEELVNYKLVQEQILYDVNLDGILE